LLTSIFKTKNRRLSPSRIKSFWPLIINSLHLLLCLIVLFCLYHILKTLGPPIISASKKQTSKLNSICNFNHLLPCNLIYSKLPEIRTSLRILYCLLKEKKKKGLSFIYFIPGIVYPVIYFSSYPKQLLQMNKLWNAWRLIL
jgi:hypothetical protein